MTGCGINAAKRRFRQVAARDDDVGVEERDQVHVADLYDLDHLIGLGDQRDSVLDIVVLFDFHDIHSDDDLL
jgi:hypothetical protein